jgi:hypothetical protein
MKFYALTRDIGHDSVVIVGVIPYKQQITSMNNATAILVFIPGLLVDLSNKVEEQLD